MFVRQLLETVLTGAHRHSLKSRAVPDKAAPAARETSRVQRLQAPTVPEKILVTSAADIKAGRRRALCHVRKENSLAVSASSWWSPNLLTTAWDLELTPQLAPTPCSQSSVLLLTSLLLEHKASRRAPIPFSTDLQGPQIQRPQQGLFTSIHIPTAPSCSPTWLH